MRTPPLLRTTLVAATIVALDQLTKAWILAHAAELSGPPPTVGLTLTMNSAIAFSLPVSGWMVYVLAAVVLAVVGPILVRSLEWRNPWSAVVAGAIVGGAVGNLIDRVRFGAVVDFVKVGWWPVFNVADAALSCAIVATLLFGKRLFRSTERVTVLGFNEALVPLVQSGEKILTYRLNPIYRSLKVGDVLDAENTQTKQVFGRVRITSIERHTVGTVPLVQPSHESFPSREALRETLSRFYGPVQDDTPVLVLRFEFLPDEGRGTRGEGRGTRD